MFQENSLSRRISVLVPFLLYICECNWTLKNLLNNLSKNAQLKMLFAFLHSDLNCSISAVTKVI